MDDFLTPQERAVLTQDLRTFFAQHPEIEHNEQLPLDPTKHDSLAESEQMAVNLMPHDAAAPAIDFSKIEHYKRSDQI